MSNSQDSPDFKEAWPALTLQELYGQPKMVLPEARWERLRWLCERWVAEATASANHRDDRTNPTILSLSLAATYHRAYQLCRDLEFIFPTFSPLMIAIHPAHQMFNWVRYNNLGGKPENTPASFHWNSERCDQIISILTACSCPDVGTPEMEALYALSMSKPVDVAQEILHRGRSQSPSSPS